MSSFDEQIRTRKAADQEAFADSLCLMAGTVMGKRLSDALDDDRRVTEDAIGDILKYYRLKPTKAPEDVKDTNEIMEILLRPHGIMRRRVVLDKDWDRKAAGPMLARRKEDGSVVALIPLGIRHYQYYDHKNDRLVLITKKNRDEIDSEAMVFYKPFPLKKLTAGSLLRYIAELADVWDIFHLVIAMAAVTGVGMLLPWITRMLFSDVLESGNTGLLMGTGIFLLCAAVSGILFSAIRDFMSARISIRLNLSVESAMMMRILSLPASFFRDYTSGELSSRAGYMTALCSRIADAVLSAGLTALFSLAYISQLLAFAPSLTVPAVLVTVLTLAVTVVTILLQTQVSRKQMLLAGKESGASYAVISGMQKIRLTGSEKRAFAKWGGVYAKEASLLYDPPFFLKISPVITAAISLLGTMFIWGAAIRSGVSTADYYAFSSAYGSVSGAFSSLAGIASLLAGIEPMLDMLKPFMETEPEIAEDRKVVTSLSGGIELSHVTFRYKENEPIVLDDIDLKIEPGEYIAVTGTTGSGKSTLMRVMLGLETPQRGSVYYDGEDLRNLDLRSLRRKIGTVMQDGKLFSGDIYSNISVTAPQLTVEEAWEAAETAGIADDIRRMPMQMFTQISEGQGGVSGGQRQRILIARAIAPKPKVLFFDEATSALDNVTQKKISEALDRLNCTRIVIAHRLSTIQQCDRILVMDKGRVVEDGTYDELMERNGLFAELVKRQQM